MTSISPIVLIFSSEVKRKTYVGTVLNAARPDQLGFFHSMFSVVLFSGKPPMERSLTRGVRNRNLFLCYVFRFIFF